MALTRPELLRETRRLIALAIIRDNPSTLEYVNCPQMIPIGLKLQTQVGVLRSLCKLDISVRLVLKYAYRRRKKTIPPQQFEELFRREQL